MLRDIFGGGILVYLTHTCSKAWLDNNQNQAIIKKKKHNKKPIYTLFCPFCRYFLTVASSTRMVVTSSAIPHAFTPRTRR